MEEKYNVFLSEELSVESEAKDLTEAAAEAEPEAAAGQNSTDEEKLLIGAGGSVEERQAGFSLNNRYFSMLFWKQRG